MEGTSAHRIRKWLPPVSLAFLLGILIGFRFSPSIYLLFFLLSPVLIFMLLFVFRSFPGGGIFVLLTFLLVGAIMARFQAISLDDQVFLQLAEERKVVEIQGVVASQISRGDHVYYFDLKVKRLTDLERDWRTNKKIRVLLPFGKEPDFERGSVVTILGKLRAVEGQKIQRGFLKDLFWKEEGPEILFYGFAGQAKVTKKSGGLIAALLQFIHRRATLSFERYLGRDQAAFMRAMVLGDRSDLSEDLNNDFRDTGLFHIIAISGQHMTILSSLLFALLNPFPISRRAKIFLALLFIAFYGVLTGLGPSVFRSVVMAFVLMLGMVLGRERDMLSSISLSLVVLLAINPQMVFDVGLQLSFLATLGIVLLSPFFLERLERLPAWLAQIVAVSLASQLAVAPILAINFHRISLIALIGNIVVLPVVPPLLGAGVLSAALASLAISFTRPLMLLTDFILRYLFWVVHLLAELPFSTLEIWSFGTGGALIYYLFLFSVFPFWQKIKLNSRQRRIITVAVALLLLILLLAFFLFPETSPQALTVSVLDVGQGDSILIQSREGINILVDGGEDPWMAYEKLRKRGVRHLDLVILSHPHEDHLNGLLKVIEKLPVGAVLGGDHGFNSFPYQEFKEIIEQKKISYRVARRGEVLDIGPDLKLMVLWPDYPPAFFDESQVNNLSVVVKLVYQKFTLLLSGDIEGEGQQQLVDEEAPLASVVFKVPHHGSIDALNQEFFERVKPQIAVISVGAGNEFGHPSKKVLHILESMGAKIFRTDLNGDIVIKTDGYRVEVLSRS